MIGSILDWFRGRNGDYAAEKSEDTTSPEAGFDTQVLVQGGLADLKRITRLLQAQSVDSQIIVPPSGCNT